MAIEDIEKFRGPWQNPVWVRAALGGAKAAFGAYEWLTSPEQPGYFFLCLKGDRWLYLFTDPNVAFEFKMRWGGE